MQANDLQIRMARKMKLGRGSMQITQADLDTLVQCGAYTALCEAATEELKNRSISRRTPVQAGVEVMPSQAAKMPNVDAEIARAMATLPKTR